MAGWPARADHQARSEEGWRAEAGDGDRRVEGRLDRRLARRVAGGIDRAVDHARPAEEGVREPSRDAGVAGEDPRDRAELRHVAQRQSGGDRADLGIDRQDVATDGAVACGAGVDAAEAGGDPGQGGSQPRPGAVGRVELPPLGNSAAQGLDTEDKKRALPVGPAAPFS
ncbi:hypothetical protein SPHINGO391_440034 [Sphingomonas aurantiaca]|uniref:Uncharacterized protein n=1 Tax=Sphingomonas aurantiaca TaxID=185949 RepID=A0A5E7Z327_9SPHN|nr:hypothetical protein SPHINGO391_440034 [Sphingomonas aurantiaca]